MKLDAKLNQALVNLKPNSDFKTVTEYLTNYEAQLANTAIYANENADVYRGMARSVREVLKAFNAASNN